MKPTLNKPTWAGNDWPERSEKAMSLLSLLIEPSYCGSHLYELFRMKKNDRIYKDLAVILCGNDFPSSIQKVAELTLVWSDKCECKECVFNQYEMV